LARESQRLRIGTMVSVIAFRQPAYLAAQVLTLDHISHGRVELGLGAGTPPENAQAAFGMGDWSARERADRLEEQASLLAGLLRGEPTTSEGRYYSVKGAKPPAPVQRPRPPFIIAAHGERG